jgi:DNA invertase Pin-like site-specific DNA recombinase
MSTDKRLGRKSGIFDTREELEATVRRYWAREMGSTVIADKVGVSKATVNRILNPGVERKNKIAREDGTNPLIPTLNSLWIVREHAA